MTAPRAARVETPADILRRAAGKVRELASKASVGPWRDQGEDVEEDGFPFHTVLNGGVGMREHAVVHTFALNPRRAEDAAWVAFASPAIGEPLAAWLDDTAAAIDQRRTMVAELAPPNWVISALNLAHVVLGSPVPEPDGEGTT